MENPNTDSVDPKTNPSTPAAEPPRKPNLVPEVPPAVESKRETCHCKPDQTPLWKIILETSAVLVGCAVAGIYYGQLIVMRGQLGEIIKQYPQLQKSADAAKDAAIAAGNSADTQTKAFHLEQRAWVMPFVSGTPSIVLGKEIMIPFALMNTGKTPALAVDGDVAVGLLKKNDLPEFVYKQHSGHPVYKIKGGIIFPNESMTASTISYAVLEHGKEFIYRKAKPIILTPELDENLKRGMTSGSSYSESLPTMMFLAVSTGRTSVGPFLSRIPSVSPCSPANTIAPITTT